MQITGASSPINSNVDPVLGKKEVTLQSQPDSVQRKKDETTSAVAQNLQKDTAIDTLA